MKTISILSITGLAVLSIGSVQASEQSYLYKDQRIMAMGGANVAVGGYSTSLFSNPAGVAKISNDHGMVVELLGLQLGISTDSQDLINDLSDAIDSGNENEILDVFNDYSGQTVHVDVSNYSSISNNHDTIAWSVGLLSAVDANFTAHGNSFGLLETQARAYGGLTGAMSYTFKPFENGDDLSVGLGLKMMTQQSYEGTITPAELINFDDIENTLEEKYEKDGTAFSADLGAIYQFNDTYLTPSIGLSILNIGELDFDSSYGSQPMTINIGASIEPEFIYAKKTIIAIDYVDLLNENSTRSYNIGTGETVTYTDTEDSDVVKRLRFGVSSLLYENTWSSFTVAAGLYQGSYTAGFSLTASILQIGFTTYEEQLGPQFNDQSDRRYSINAGLVW